MRFGDFGRSRYGSGNPQVRMSRSMARTLSGFGIDLTSLVTDAETAVTDISNGNVTGAITAATSIINPPAAPVVKPAVLPGSMASYLTPTNIVIGLAAIGAVFYFSRSKKSSPAAA